MKSKEQLEGELKEACRTTNKLFEDSEATRDAWVKAQRAHDKAQEAYWRAREALCDAVQEEK